MRRVTRPLKLGRAHSRYFNKTRAVVPASIHTIRQMWLRNFLVSPQIAYPQILGSLRIANTQISEVRSLYSISIFKIFQQFVSSTRSSELLLSE
jgi:hypothetical protein